MTTKAENEILTRTDAGTTMGELMRQYWIPAAKSDELRPDGDPMRLKLLGEKLIAFRDSSGSVGIMDHRCPHRCASLFFGRNEENGIRCVYHGWKYDVDGNCLDQANVPTHQDFKHKVKAKAKAYKTAERNGVVWVFMGDQKNIPELPMVESTLVPEEQLEIRFTMRECNWLQGVEGELDTSHVGIMHFGSVGTEVFGDDDYQRHVVANRAPEYKLQETDYGYMYAGYRPGDSGEIYYRFGHFLFPFWTMPPINTIETNVLTRAYVPIDDENLMIVSLVKDGAYVNGATAAARGVVGGTQNYPYLPNSTDWLGRWRLKLNRDNDFGIDRDVQRTKSFTGIEGVQMQDQAVQESMGAILDRSLEHLAPSDQMITTVRRMLIRAAHDLEKTGAVHKSAADHTLYDRVRGGHFSADDAQDWLDAYNERVASHPWEAVMPQAAE